MPISTTRPLDLLSSIQVPSDFTRIESIPDNHLIAQLDEWKGNAYRVLTELQILVEANSANLSAKECADVISAVASFDGSGAWVTPASKGISREILEYFRQPTVPLLVQILSHNVKPLFKSNPHPSLNVTTGRKLDRPAGGPMASQDYYEGQTWKSYPGASNLVSWCVRHIERETYEELWHLVIPPVITLLDDYEAKYKLRGVEIVSEMLGRVPKEVLKRTGVDGLLLTSLNTCLAHLQSPETPSLLRAAIAAALSLILLTTSPGSVGRFEKLCGLLGEGIINGVWLYGAEKWDTILASLDALPPVINALGIGNVRYLNALIPQLVHPLLPNPLNPSPVELQIGSLSVLVVVIDQCAPRMYLWKATILDAACRCWVNLMDSEHEASCDLKMQLRYACERLAEACPSVIQDEYEKLFAADPKMFGDLISRGPMM